MNTRSMAPNTAGSSGNVAYIPPPGVVSEVKAQTSPFDAGNGFSTGGSINVFPEVRHQSAARPDVFLPAESRLRMRISNLAGLPRDNYRQNRWGVNANGPVYIPKVLNGRNRHLLDVRLRGDSAFPPQSSNNGVYTRPTAAQRQGDFSISLALGSKVYDLRPGDYPARNRRPLQPAALQIRFPPAASTRTLRDRQHLFSGRQPPGRR